MLNRNLRGWIDLAVRANSTPRIIGAKSGDVMTRSTRAVGMVVRTSSTVMDAVASSSSSSIRPETTVACSSMSTREMTSLTRLVRICTCSSSSVTIHSRFNRSLNTFNHGSNLSSISAKIKAFFRSVNLILRKCLKGCKNRVCD